MASYSIVYKPSVEKDLRSLPRTTVMRVMKRIDSLRDDPVSRYSVKLTGSKGLYRIRVGDYRVIYGVDEDTNIMRPRFVSLTSSTNPRNDSCNYCSRIEGRCWLDREE
jgi:mRNA interferase RelE/StbE